MMGGFHGGVSMAMGVPQVRRWLVLVKSQSQMDKNHGIWGMNDGIHDD